MEPTAPTASGARGRLLAPDFARGAMLLLILLSNTAFFLYAGDYTRSDEFPDPTGPADSVTQFLMTALLDVRIYPLFAFLVGYGIVQVFTRRQEAGLSEAEAAAQVRRRNLWLMVIGFVHALLLLATEVLAAYGLIGLVLCALFLRAGERRMRGWVIAGVSVLVVGLAAAVALFVAAHALDPAVTSGVPAVAEEGNRSTLSGSGEESYLVSAVFRVLTWGLLLLINVFGAVLPTAMLLGMWAARRRVIEEPRRHLRLLRTVAVGGFTIGLLGALPEALMLVGAWDPPPFDGLTGAAAAVASWTTGLAGGLGYVAIFVLAAERLTRSGRVPGPVGAVSALGKRSLSGYLTHSVVMVPVLSAWGLGLGAHLTSATTALFAFGLWLATVVAAALMERRGLRGPCEVALRRLMQGRRPDTAHVAES
ncbi:DUF418 domain-containing protein [Nocardiopsis salina]|uniref:DUF418 domain-containing protein n=1 Tax=Nocardiopsis salina TaxID=245836 RepID=UPI000347F079|nr:DUF418 domain-containing protein [Nocardiopsis salina]